MLKSQQKESTKWIEKATENNASWDNQGTCQSWYT